MSSMAVHGMFKSPSKTYIQLKTRDENIKVMLTITYDYNIMYSFAINVCLLIKIFFLGGITF